jgi:hypothetical protein
MQIEELSSGLCRTACAILEEVAFVTAEPMESPISWETPMIEISIAFSGPVQGVMTLVATSDFGSALAANFLGVEEEELAEGEDEGSLAEFSNILMGAVAEQWFDSEGCGFGLPKVRRLTPAEHISTREAASFSLSLETDEEQHLEFAVALESEEDSK